MRHDSADTVADFLQLFPFLFGGTFIEAAAEHIGNEAGKAFPFLFGGTFIEASILGARKLTQGAEFPFLFGGTFIEAVRA